MFLLEKRLDMSIIGLDEVGENSVLREISCSGEKSSIENHFRE
ncbi:MAG: hypothetical protein ABWJ42_05585 [Sulfolobales archaeon]